jgi:hypothetical protein
MNGLVEGGFGLGDTYMYPTYINGWWEVLFFFFFLLSFYV